MTRALSLLCALLLACPPKPDGPGPAVDEGWLDGPRGSTTLVISGFLQGSIFDGQGEQCIRIANVSDEPIDVTGYSLTNRYGPGYNKTITFPAGAEESIVPPHGEIVVARDAQVYRSQFGEDAHFELGPDADNPGRDDAVPDMDGRGWPLAVADYKGGVLALVAPDEDTIVDAVVWDFESKSDIPGLTRGLRSYENKHDLPIGAIWSGKGLDPWGNLHSPFTPRSRLFIRDHDRDWRFLPDTNSYRDWDAGSSLQHVGEDPTHRIMAPGQSRFQPPVRTERAIIRMTSAPDNNYQATIEAWAQAEEEIWVSVYYFKHLYMMDALLEAIERGVDVTVFMEGGTVGVANGFPDEERWIAKQIEEAGRERSGDPERGLGRVYWLGNDTKAGYADRYAFDHSKYTVVDRRIMVIGSENYGMTGHPVDPSYGNRGWEIQVHTPPGEEPLGVVQDLVAVWLDDVDPDNHLDVRRYSDDPEDLDPQTGRGRYGPPPAGFEPDGHVRDIRPGRYWSPYPHEAPTIEDEATFQLVMSPDNCLNEEDSIIGAIMGAEEEILVNHLDLRLFWGSGRIKTIERSPENTPSLITDALVAAARRGVRVRALIDCSGFGCETGGYQKKLDNNDDLVNYFRRLADEEGLDIEAALIDNWSTEDLEKDWQRIDDEEDFGLSKIHNKGLVIDGRTVLFSSINGSENSFKGNREMALLVTHPEVGAHYAGLFYYDWTTVAAPTRVEALPGETPLGTCDEEDRLGTLLVGLEPRTRYHVRVTAFDTDDSDVDRLDMKTPIHPHESPLSEEVEVWSDHLGIVGVAWDANHSEDVEGDLGGYRVYWATDSFAGLPTVPDTERAGLELAVVETAGCE